MAALDEPGVFSANASAATTLTIATLATAASDHSPNLFARNWVYVATGAAAGLVRIIREGSFVPSTGVFNVDPGWTGPTLNDEVEITALFPAIMADTTSGRVARTTSYRTLMNRGLSRLLVPDRVALAITTSRTYSTATWPWLDRETRLVRVLEPSPVSGGLPFDARWRNPKLRLDGPTPTLTLDVPFTSASGDLTLEVLRPGDTLISGAESTAGYTAAADIAIVSLNDVVAVTLLEAFAVLRQRSVARPQGSYMDRHKEQLAICRKLAYWDWTLDSEAPAAAPVEAA